MARPIDADAVLDRYYAEYERQDICDGAEDREWLMKCLNEAPTLTPPNEWLRVEERLPEHLKDVLALYGNGKIDIDWVDSSGDFKFGSLFDGVTHWMPLPAPPDRRPPEGEEDT